MYQQLAQFDPEIAASIRSETERQEYNLEFIASENFVSEAVMEAQGSVMTNKYAEGYPGKRYYGGCEMVDIAEELAIERAKQLFGAEHANVQPPSGSQANMAVYFAVCNPGDTVLGMNLAHGGHLTHGSPVNFSGKLFNIVSYGVRQDTGYIDYEEVERLALQHQPKLIVVGASAYPRTIDCPAFRQIADQIGAKIMVDMAHIAGLVAAGLHPSPVPHAEFVTTTTHKTLRGPRGGMILCQEEYAKTINANIFPGIQGGPLMHVIAAKAVCFYEAMQPSFQEYQHQVVLNAKELAKTLQENGLKIFSGGTDNHLMLVDLRELDVTGLRVQMLLDSAHITANKNAIPFDTRNKLETSGMRFGTPASTTRGMKEPEMRQIGNLIARIIKEGEAAVPQVKAEVLEICKRFPLYQ